MKIHKFLIVILSLIIFVIASFNSGFFHKKLGFDEVHYVNAAKKGIIINAIDGSDPSFLEFAKFGLAKYQKDYESIERLTQTMIPEEDQLFHLRHFHPPVPVYFWSFFVSNDSKLSDLRLRFSSVIFFIFFISSFLIMGNKSPHGSLSLSPIQALLAISFFTSQIFFWSNASLNFHIFHALACLFFSYSLQNFLVKSSKKNEWILAFSLAGLFLTLETGVFVAFIGLLILVFMKGLKYVISLDLIKILFKGLFILIILWPGIIFSGAPLKSWLMYAYRIFVNANEEYATVQILNNYKSLFLSNTLLIILSIISLLTIIFYRKNIYRESFYVPAILGLSYGIFLSPFILSFTYFIPALSLIIFALYNGLRSTNV